MEKLHYSELRRAPRAVLRDAVPLPAPFTIFVEPTNICNFNCVYCPESFENFEARAGGLSRMDIEAFARVSDQIKEMGRIKTLNFYMMGEPLANRQLPDFIKIARRKEIADRIILTTNGSLLDEKAARRILDAELDYLRVSVYGGNAQSFARKTQTRIPLERVQRNVERFSELRDALKARTFVYVKMIDSGDPDENREFLERFTPIADEAAIEPVMNWNDPSEGNLAQMDSQSLLRGAHFQHRKTICPQPFYTLVVHADLRVSVCCVDWAKEAVVGDLKTQTLSEVWSGAALRDFHVAHLEGRRSELTACKNCTFLHTMPDSLEGLRAEEYLARSSVMT
jgi:sulfatase maturation enzyme AslB (radical SAM superfamily)